MNDDIGAAGDAPPHGSAAGGVAAPISRTYSDHAANHWAPWTEADRAKFTPLWLDATLSRADVAARMGRTRTACDQYATSIQLRRVPRPKVSPAARSGPVPKLDAAGRAAAEKQAGKIRAYWADRGKTIIVEVVYMPGTYHHPGCWSPRIVDNVAASKGAV